MTMIIDQLGKIQLINADCMRVLSELPGNAFDLAICDPPYGIGIDGQKACVCKNLNITASITHARVGMMQYPRQRISGSLNEYHAIRLFGVQTTSLNICKKALRSGLCGSRGKRDLQCLIVNLHTRLSIAPQGLSQSIVLHLQGKIPYTQQKSQLNSIRGF